MTTQPEFEFQEWIACPACGEPDQVSTLAYKNEMVIECYECGLISEFVIGEDRSLQNLDAEAITGLAESQPSG